LKTAIALTSCDIGLGTGLFTSLKLTHLISAYRLQEDHLLRLAQGMWPEKLLQYYQNLQMDSRTRRLHAGLARLKPY